MVPGWSYPFLMLYIYIQTKTGSKCKEQYCKASFFHVLCNFFLFIILSGVNWWKADVEGHCNYLCSMIRSDENDTGPSHIYIGTSVSIVVKSASGMCSVISSYLNWYITFHYQNVYNNTCLTWRQQAFMSRLHHMKCVNCKLGKVGLHFSLLK